ncbi:MAG TPA: class II aldolase/adducin family protein [Candidatus Dormibacteraeota bacterium]|nr:class II aldolase/adducin family protein [Candidatus Dormibacteraeota bacterium]
MKDIRSSKELATRLDSAEISALVDFSTRLGRNPLLVQASNGNTSVKLGGVLWIKASGTWLEHAQWKGNFVPVDLEQAREAVRTRSVIFPVAGTDLSSKPSIETAMHAVLPHRVVAHVHSINTIAWAVRRDAPEHLAAHLAGLRWQWIPYSASGVPLARQIEKALSASPDAEIFVLANHGLVVCGTDCAAVEALLLEVERRLEVQPRVFPEPEPALSMVIARSPDWSLPVFRGLHALATDSFSRSILKGGILYPCMAMFLGVKTRMLPHSVPLSRFAEYANGSDGQRTFVIIEDAGVILHKQITLEQRATLVALSRITQRIDASAPLRYLTCAEVTALLNTDQHAYQMTAETGSEASAAHPS